MGTCERRREGSERRRVGSERGREGVRGGGRGGRGAGLLQVLCPEQHLLFEAQFF